MPDIHFFCSKELGELQGVIAPLRSAKKLEDVCFFASLLHSSMQNAGHIFCFIEYPQATRSLCRRRSPHSGVNIFVLTMLNSMALANSLIFNAL